MPLDRRELFSDGIDSLIDLTFSWCMALPHHFNIGTLLSWKNPESRSPLETQERVQGRAYFTDVSDREILATNSPPPRPGNVENRLFF